MPTPRAHGGAALQHIPLTVPGFQGVNSQAAQSILGPEWATYMLNAVLDENNRVAARKGWENLTSVPIAASPQIVQGFEYRKSDGTVELIVSCDNSTLQRSTDDGSTWTDVTGTAVIVDPNLQFVNFADVLIGVQEGGNPIFYDGTVFGDVVDAGFQPTGGAVVSAFGRLWITNTTGTEVQYCALLDYTDWENTPSSDTGVISIENVWPESDKIVAIAAFNGSLIIFGQNNIIVYTDGRGSAIGIDPTEMYAVDTITGIGCVAQHSVQNVKGDLWFLSKDGLQSLGRLLQQKSNPLNNLSKNVQDALIQAINDPELDLTAARSVYSPEDRFYLLSLPRPYKCPDGCYQAPLQRPVVCSA